MRDQPMPPELSECVEVDPTRGEAVYRVTPSPLTGAQLRQDLMAMIKAFLPSYTLTSMILLVGSIFATKSMVAATTTLILGFGFTALPIGWRLVLKLSEAAGETQRIRVNRREIRRVRRTQRFHLPLDTQRISLSELRHLQLAPLEPPDPTLHAAHDFDDPADPGAPEELILIAHQWNHDPVALTWGEPSLITALAVDLQQRVNTLRNEPEGPNSSREDLTLSGSDGFLDPGTQRAYYRQPPQSRAEVVLDSGILRIYYPSPGFNLRAKLLILLAVIGLGVSVFGAWLITTHAFLRGAITFSVLGLLASVSIGLGLAGVQRARLRTELHLEEQALVVVKSGPLRRRQRRIPWDSIQHYDLFDPTDEEHASYRCLTIVRRGRNLKILHGACRADRQWIALRLDAAGNREPGDAPIAAPEDFD